MKRPSANLRANGYPYLGHAIRERRLEMKWTLVDLDCELREHGAGIYHRLLGRYERGEITPSVPTLVAIARALDCTVDALLQRADWLAKEAVCLSK